MDNIESKEAEYRSYIDNHIKNVSVAWEKLQPLLKGKYFVDDAQWFSIEFLIKMHDLSKYGVDEFDGYRRYFFPSDGEHYDSYRFNLAWNHHQKENPHHWEYWCMIRNTEVVPLDIPEEYIFEMLCDWTAMSIRFGDTPSEFYRNNKTQMIFTDETRTLVEELLPLFDEALRKVGENDGD